jgi:UDP-N-acetylglucosamine--N-acetylmuramyl-(pentapeptide) pyrophosphoryl-undecaprenol N-acetylglucosamine transferase
MKVVLIGGHLSPALAVIDALPKEIEVVFIGRKHATEGEEKESFEFKTITAKGIPFFNLVTGRLQRSFSTHSLRSLGKIPGGFSMTYQILKEQKPHVVVSFGGYLSVPVCFVAKTLHIPVIIHEQTLRAGLANKVTAKVASKICLSWEDSQPFFPKKKSIVTGNPIRKEITDVALLPKKTNLFPTLYITGGSTGSHIINESVKKILPQLLEKYIIYHQAGNVKGYTSFDDLNLIKAALPHVLQERYFLTDHYPSYESAAIMHKADIVISRSGINTVTELLYLNKPAILIPLLFGQHNEQEINAQFLQKAGLGNVILQKDVTSELLLSQIRQMFASINTYTLKHDMQQNERNMHAAEKLVEVILHVASNPISQKTHPAS